MVAMVAAMTAAVMVGVAAVALVRMTAAVAPCLQVNQYADYDGDPKATRYGDGKGDPERVAPPPHGPGNIRVFKRDPTSGELTPSCVLEVDEPLGIYAAEEARWGA